MCSISGYVAFNEKVNPNFIINSFELMRHRGPEFEDHIRNKNVVLGHQRLAIIDLSDRANQPMEFEQDQLVFNGEIFNYKELAYKYLSNEKTFTSDTEVLIYLLKKKGLSILNELNGMFAFCWYSHRKNEIYIVRDRFGIKPVYYTVHAGNFYFTSEIKPLIRVRSSLEYNINTIDSFFTDTATDFDDKTFVKDIFQIKPSHYLRLSCSELNKIEQKVWYEGNDFTIDPLAYESFQSAADYLNNLLCESVRLRLMADVPVSISLSGGLDSTVLYSIIKKDLNRSIKVISYANKDSGIDESLIVKRLIAQYGDVVTYCNVPESVSYELYVETQRSLEMPIWSIASIAYHSVYDKIKKSDIKVVIEGHGADELLGGYPYMLFGGIQSLIAQKKYKTAYQAYKFYRHDLSDIDNRSTIQSLRDFFYIVRRKKKPKDYFDSILEDAFQYKILPITLRCFDRMSMANSVESRSPFLDYRVVEFCKELPIEYKVNGLGSKAILRQILKKYGHHFIANQTKKIGFSANMPKFFDHPPNKTKVLNNLNHFDLSKFGVNRNLLEKAKESYKSKSDWNNTFLISKFNGLAECDNVLKSLYD